MQDLYSQQGVYLKTRNTLESKTIQWISNQRPSNEGKLLLEFI